MFSALFSLNPNLSPGATKIYQKRKDSRKQLLRRILGVKSKEERQGEVKEQYLQMEDADSVPELQSGLAEDYLDDSLEDIDAREKIQLKGHTPTLEDYQEQTTQESVHNDLKGPFVNDFELN